jgi:deoxyribodipyrimidine photo-lyase
MQSGTTGINSIRIYNPIKQGIDHDPNGSFIRQWVPELVPLDNRFIHTPWLAMAEGQMSFNGYPRPIVDEKDARQSAAARLYGLRKQTDHATTARAIVQKHASRKGDSAKNNASKTSHHKKRNRPSQSPAKSETQITFSFED